MKLSRVLVGIDFSAPSLAAARWAAASFAPHAELMLVHVIPEARSPSYLAWLDSTSLPEVVAAERSAALLRALMGLATSIGGVRATADVRIGEPAAQLSRAARELHADVIVTGRAGQRTTTGTGRQLGTTADRLVRSASVPVLVAARVAQGAPRSVFAAIDDSRIGDSVLAWSVHLARELDTRLTVLHVVDRGEPAAGECTTRSPHEAKEASAAGVRAIASEDVIRDAAEAWLRSRVRQAGYDPSDADIAIAVGDTRHELLAAAECLAAGLVVIGRQGADGSERTGIGSTTRAALRPSSRPVLVIPPTETAPTLADPFRGRESRVLSLGDRGAARTSVLQAPAGPPAARTR